MPIVMAESAASKEEAVCNWLQLIFGDEPIPSFRKSSSLIDHLYELMTSECLLDKKSQCYADFLATSIRDYMEDSECKVRTINRLGLGGLISSPGFETSSLASIANDTSLSTVDETSYILALTDLVMNKEHTILEANSLRKLVEDEKNELTEAIKLQSQLEASLEKLSQQQIQADHVTKTQSRETTFLLNKTSKYKADQKKQELKLSKSGVTQNLTHNRILADYKELQSVTQRIGQTREELDKFADLPPDKDLARVKLEVAKSQLREMEDELVRQIDICHL